MPDISEEEEGGSTGDVVLDYKVFRDASGDLYVWIDDERVYARSLEELEDEIRARNPQRKP